MLIAHLKRNLNELKRDKENMVKEVCQSRKILGNMLRMKEIAIEDNRKLYNEFKCTMEKENRLDTSTCEKLNISNAQISTRKISKSKRCNSRLTHAESKKSLKFWLMPLE